LEISVLFIIWQGLGAYVFVIPFFLWLGFHFVARVVLGVDDVAQGLVINGLALLASSPIVYVIAHRLAAQPGREMIDEATGQEITLRQEHTFFFVPMRYWAVLFAFVGAVLVIAAAVAALS